MLLYRKFVFTKKDDYKLQVIYFRQNPVIELWFFPENYKERWFLKEIFRDATLVTRLIRKHYNVNGKGSQFICELKQKVNSKAWSSYSCSSVRNGN